MRTLIRHNQKDKAEAIFSHASNIKAYTLENGFTGKPANKLDCEGNSWLMRNWLMFNFARLTKDGDNKFTLHIHSNCWYEFEAETGD